MAMKVNYPKQEVLKTWYSIPVKKREELLTFDSEELISLVNCVNASLMLKELPADESCNLLELIDTIWEPRLYMQVNPKTLKGTSLVSLLESPSFLEGEKSLYVSEQDLCVLFKNNIASWRSLEEAVRELIEQRILFAHFQSLQSQSERFAEALLKEESLKTAKKKKKKNKNKSKSKKPKKTPQKEIVRFEYLGEEFIPKLNYAIDNFILDLSDNSTIADADLDPNELFFFDENTLGARAHSIRRFYANKSIVWDEEMDYIRNVEGRPAMDPFERFTYPVVQYYYYYPSPYFYTNFRFAQ